MNPSTENASKPNEPVNYDLYLLQSLINLVKVDNQVQASERTFVEQRINNSALTTAEKEGLIASLSSSEVYDKPYLVFAHIPEKKNELIAEIMQLAKVDEYLSLTERIYLRQMFKGLGLEESEILALMLK